MKKYLFLFSIFLPFYIFAEQNIEIVGGNNVNIPRVAIVDFTNDLNDNDITNIIVNDLKITGEFLLNKYPNIDMVESTNEYIVSGKIESTVSVYKLAYKLINNNESKSIILDQNIEFNAKDLRKNAHTISNNIYQTLTNTPGIFNTKIAYIATLKNKYNLIVSDYDGYNPSVLLLSKSPISSISWNSDGSQIAYVSLESGKPVVYVQDIYKKNRYKVANFIGSNSSPAFTADGSKLAVTLTKDNGSHIYLVNNAAFNPNSYASNIINFATIDTEASIAKNGNIIFTSNKDGGPQIFLAGNPGESSTRLTMNLGNYNTTARWAHDLSKITFINRTGGILKTYVLNLIDNTAYPVSVDTSLDMSPSFSPNDKLILFSSNNSVYIVNALGTVQTKLNISADTIIDQLWANNF
ncbi:MAG TPA: hypothetical protein PKD00_01990 [Burkholderiales bacterium]|nr:hypothetical protein [Burkholderiales bacterium]